MKKLIVLILLLLLIFTQTCFAETYFSDTFNHWGNEDILYATNTLKVFRGYEDMTFRPDNNITRAEYIAILVRTASKMHVVNEVYRSNLNYKDLSFKDWSYTYIITLDEYMNTHFKEYSLKDVFPGQYFEPSKPITREEAIALTGVFSTKSIFDNKAPFRDVAVTSKYYTQIQNLYNNGILSGYEDNTLRPRSNISRAESAALIRRIYDDMTYSYANVFKSIEFMPVKGEDISSFFGNYTYNNQNDNDKKYVKAKNTLEYISFGGYIFPEDEHLYDANALETLSTLRKNGYSNVAGVNYYLLSFGNLANDEKNKLVDEILNDIIKRSDLTDSDIMQLFRQICKNSPSEELFNKALEKWYGSTSNVNVKLNIKIFRYSYYIKNNNRPMLNKLLAADLRAGTDINKIVASDFSINATQAMTNSVNDYSYAKLYFTVYFNSNLNIQKLEESTKEVSILNTISLVKNTNQLDISTLLYHQDLYYRFSLNRAYTLNYLGQRERAFTEALNDWYIMKKLDYNNKVKIDNNYKSILKTIRKSM